MDTSQREEVVAQVRRLMIQQGLSQADLAKKAGVSENTISGFLTGKKDTQQGTLRKILDALGIVPAGPKVVPVDDAPADVVAFLEVCAFRLHDLDDRDREHVLVGLYGALLRGIADVERTRDK